MTKPTPVGKHSILHEAVFLGAGMVFPILDASAFHGHVDSIDRHLDAVRHLGQETIRGEECDKIEVGLAGFQRTRLLWIAKRDHLPRKLKEVVRVSYDHITDEEWTSVTINGTLPDSLFAWAPPRNWTQWQLPAEEDSLLRPGTSAPDFDLTSLGGEPVSLSRYRGRPVWLCFWRIGCPPCRVEMPYLQKLSGQHKELAILAINDFDDQTLTLEFLRDQGITFPVVLDTSEKAAKIFQEYGGGAMPMNYLLNGEGKVVDAWFGLAEPARTAAALEKAGLRMSEVTP